MRVLGRRGEAVGGALDGHGVQAEALGRRVPRLAALEELEGLGAGRRASGPPRARGSRRRSTMLSTWPRRGPSTRLARRSTAMTSATSDSMACDDLAGATDAPRRSARARGCATRRGPGTARAPRTRTVRRLPWPSLRGGPTAAYGSPPAAARNGGRPWRRRTWAGSWALDRTLGGRSGGRYGRDVLQQRYRQPRGAGSALGS